MHQLIHSEHLTDENGNPAGGYFAVANVTPEGYLDLGSEFTKISILAHIAWQDGPILRVKGTIPRSNGLFVETLIDACIDRLGFYQTAADGKFACEENARAIHHLREALEALDARTAKRVALGIEGTHEVES
jgi:hypothetical protein